MNPEQQQFYDYVTALVDDGKLEELKGILAENFKRQDDGTMTKEYMMESGPKLIATLKPEHQAEFQKTMAQFMSNI